MNILKNKWFEYIYIPGHKLIIFLIFLALIASAIVGYFTPKVINELYSIYQKGGDFNKTITFLMALFVGEYLSSVVYQISLNRYIQKLLEYIRTKSYRKWILTYESIGTGKFSSRNYPLGEVLSRILNDTEAIIEMVSSGSFKIFIDLAFIISCLISFIELNTVSGIALIIAEVIVCILLVIGSQKMSVVYMAVRKSTGDLNRAIANLSAGLRFTFHTPNNQFASRSAVDPCEDFLNKQLKANVWDASYFAIAESLFPILLVLLVLIFPYSNITEMAVIAAIIDLIQRSISPIKEIANKISSIQRAKTGMLRIFEFNEDLATLPSSKLHDTEDLITNFKNIIIKVDQFSYQSDSNENNFELKDITIEGKKGELIGIVGMSGSGKSTLLKILSTEIIAEKSKVLIEEDSGKQLIFHGDDITEIAKYKKQVSIISQDSHVFSESLKFNITFNQKTDEEFNHFWSDVLEKIPYLKKWGINPNDKLTPKELSLGQKQLICALRSCFLVKPIVLFDEISSGLDSELEQALRKLVLLIQSQSLTIIVAHRIETITESNRIIVMEQGRIIDQGDHDNLLARCATYQEFIAQVRG
jgi:ABC-type multidrug transport system fused ATPase/permease subunit